MTPDSLDSIYSEVQPIIDKDLSSANFIELLDWRASVARIITSIQTQLGLRNSDYRAARAKGEYLPNTEYEELCRWQRAAKLKLGGVLTLASRLNDEIRNRTIEGGNIKDSGGSVVQVRKKADLYPALANLMAALLSWDQAPTQVKDAALCVMNELQILTDRSGTITEKR